MTEKQMSRDMRFPAMWYVRPATNEASDQPAHTRSLIRAFACRSKFSDCYATV